MSACTHARTDSPPSKKGTGMEKITATLASWASILEPKTKAQACETSRMPFIYPHLALMPDAHLGKGSTVGSVIPTEGAIMPAADALLFVKQRFGPG